MNVILLTNIMTPYRKFFYDKLFNEFKGRDVKFHVVLMARTEPNRNWNYEDFQTEYSILLNGSTITISNIFIHLNKGLKHLYKQLNPDVVICAGSYMYPSLWQTLAMRKGFGYKVYYWSESHLYEERNYGGFKIKIREFIRKAVISKFDGFWFSGKFSREFIEKYASKNSDYIFVPNLVDSCKFSKVKDVIEIEKEKIANEYGVDRSKRILLIPARLSAVKGICEFIDLYKNAKSNELATVLIAGDGELKDKIERLVDKYDLDIRLLGYKSEEEMLRLYAISNVFVMPSLSDPNPLTCIEACWCGLPLLVSEHVGNYPEIIGEGKNGYVFSYMDEKAAIEYIDILIKKDRKWCEDAGKVSRNTAEEMYNPQKAVCRIVDELNASMK